MTTTLISSTQAAQRLDAALGDGSDYWLRFLQNNRRADRNPGRTIPVRISRGRPMYLADELDQYIDEERARRLRLNRVPTSLNGLLQALGQSSVGRMFDPRVSAQADSDTARFVQMVTADPLLVYRLDAEQARAIARRLVEAADAVKSALEDAA